MLRLGEGNVQQMKRFPNDASPDRDLDLPRRLRRWLRRACVAIAQAQADAATLCTLWTFCISAGYAAGILRICNRKETRRLWSQHVDGVGGLRNLSAMASVTMSG